MWFKRSALGVLGWHRIMNTLRSTVSGWPVWYRLPYRASRLLLFKSRSWTIASAYPWRCPLIYKAQFQESSSVFRRMLVIITLIAVYSFLKKCQALHDAGKMQCLSPFDCTFVLTSGWLDSSYYDWWTALCGTTWRVCRLEARNLRLSN